jgi:hypothetical protein
VLRNDWELLADFLMSPPCTAHRASGDVPDGGSHGARRAVTMLVFEGGDPGSCEEKLQATEGGAAATEKHVPVGGARGSAAPTEAFRACVAGGESH